MLCYVLFCCVMLCYVILCHVCMYVRHSATWFSKTLHNCPCTKGNPVYNEFMCKPMVPNSTTNSSYQPIPSKCSRESINQSIHQSIKCLGQRDFQKQLHTWFRGVNAILVSKPKQRLRIPWVP